MKMALGAMAAGRARAGWAFPMCAIAAAVIALFGWPTAPAQAHADDPCVGITDPVLHQACIDNYRDLYERRACEASPNHGQVGQVCG
jgi:hypothetical protein